MSDAGVLDQADAWLAEGRGVALATVVATWGSSPRPAGSLMAVAGDGAFAGSVSGGCVEAAVIAEALETIADGRPRDLDFGVADERAWDQGLPCGGSIRVRVERADHDLLAGHARETPWSVVVVGAVHITQALAPMAELAGFAVTVVDPRRAFATPERFPGARLRVGWPDEALAEAPPDARTAVIALTHDPKIDDPALVVALRSPAFHIGALGSRRNHALRLERLAGLGFGAADLARVAGPVGLDLGGRTPGEIALAIAAELVAVRHGRRREPR